MPTNDSYLLPEPPHGPGHQETVDRRPTTGPSKPLDLALRAAL